MNAKRNPLGKGLGALISDLPSEFLEEPTGVIQLSLHEITTNPDQPRKHFSEETLQELALSIAQNGIIQPIVVVQGDNGRYRIVVGERRFRAVKSLGWSHIPALVRNFEKEQLLTLALLENLQREDLNALEVAAAYQEIQERLNLTQDDLARLVGKSRSSVTNTLRLLKLPEDIREDIQHGDLSEGHGRALLSLEGDISLQRDIKNRIIRENLSVRDVEKIVRDIKKTDTLVDTHRKKGQPSTKALLHKEGNRELESVLSQIYELDVKVKSNPKGTGKIEFHFSNAKEFDELQTKLQAVLRKT